MNQRQLAIAALAALCWARSSNARADLPGESYRNHLVLSLGVGVGSLSPTEYNGYVDGQNGVAAAGGQPLQGSAAHASFELHVPILATYYFPYYLLLRTGVEAAYFFPTEKLAGGDTVTNYGGTAEVPILLGAHYAFLDNRLIAELALGPAIAGFSSAGLNGTSGYTGVQLYSDVAVGLDDELKGQFFITPGFSVGLEIGYRVLTSGPLHTSAGADVLVGGKPVHLDMSGFRGVFELGFVAF